MSEIIERIEDAVAMLLGGGATDRDAILNTVMALANCPQYSGKLSEQDIHDITRNIETRFDVSIGTGCLLESADYIPWLDEVRGDFDWYYWNRYKRLLPSKKMDKDVSTELDIITNKIVDHLENPNKEGSWNRKGLVVGHVQSGKTANYTGVICKAADAGYKVIIVLAGLLSSLRDQTQERIDEGFIGLDSSLQLGNSNLEEKLIGVGKFYEKETWRTPVPLTTNTNDFDKHIATQLRAQIGHFTEPVVLVIKKNVPILRNLVEWLRNNNPDLHKYPMLLIDDEADNASVDTSKDDEGPTATNKWIRELLSLFGQNSYLGYTATPFANIFIDPDTEDAMLNDDLFPRDFILSLDAPTNYVGASRVFEQDGDLKVVRTIKDHEDIIPLKHKIHELPDIIPETLKHAVKVFILIKAIRILRGQATTHHSMMVNVSRFKDTQSRVKKLIHEHLTDVRDSINNHYALSAQDALKCAGMRSLKGSWDKEFMDVEFSWKDVQKELKNAASPVHVIEVNSNSSEALDYNKRKYPKGRNVIAVGGQSLSRGLTLEGLTVSYFLRNSYMYDTLMQMGRWFGYRPGYEDICRIYMTKDAKGWYSHISEVTEELRKEIKHMGEMKMTPMDFGLCVRRHPESLIVTAKNKMRSSKRVLVKINLEGRLVETAVLSTLPDVLSSNWTAARSLVRAANEVGKAELFHSSHLFHQIPVEHVTSFISSYKNHPGSQKTESRPLIEYANWLSDFKGIGSWDILVVHKPKSDSQLKAQEIIQGISAKPQLRRVIQMPSNGIAQANRRVGSDIDEQAGLETDTYLDLLETYKTSSKITAKSCREKRLRPLLMIHLLDCVDDEGNSICDSGTIAFGVSFPGKSYSSRPEKLIEFDANVVWHKNHYGDMSDA